MYKFTHTTLGELKFVGSLTDLLTLDDIDIFHTETNDISRASCDGVVTLIGKIHSQPVGVIITDFRVGGGSFSKKNSKRTSAFIAEMEMRGLPIVFIINSLGVRFMEGRTVFDDAFSIIADLYRFRRNNLLITIALSKALGVSALFFAQGHFRLALEGEALLNLTGPEVHKKFFGNADADFSQYNLADHQFSSNSLIHELQPTSQALYRSAKNFILFVFLKAEHQVSTGRLPYTTEIEQGGLALLNNENQRLGDLGKQLGDSTFELFVQRSPVVRVFIGRVHDKLVGYLVNPPGHPNNMLTVRAIDKCLAAMDLFRTLKLPIISLLDCPGGDPRKAESDKDALMKMIQLTHEMIAYPYMKMGIITGRCFGGSGMFAFPKIYGGHSTIAVRGAQFGIMHRSIIEDLLSGSARLKEAWKVVADTEVPDLDDLIALGTIDRVVEKDQIRNEITHFLIMDDLERTRSDFKEGKNNQRNIN
jgi:acetyl-CoA carboxylase carboxyltransferase component